MLLFDNLKLILKLFEDLNEVDSFLIGVVVDRLVHLVYLVFDKLNVLVKDRASCPKNEQLGCMIERIIKRRRVFNCGSLP